MFSRTLLLLVAILSSGALAQFDTPQCADPGSAGVSGDCSGVISKFCDSVPTLAPPLVRRGSSVGSCLPGNGGKACTFSALNAGPDVDPPSGNDCYAVLTGVVGQCKTQPGGTGSVQHGEYIYSLKVTSGTC